MGCGEADAEVREEVEEVVLGAEGAFSGVFRGHDCCSGNVMRG